MFILNMNCALLIIIIIIIIIIIKISRYYFCAEADLYFNIFPLFCIVSFYIALFRQNIFTKLLTILFTMINKY